MITRGIRTIMVTFVEVVIKTLVDIWKHGRETDLYSNEAMEEETYKTIAELRSR